MDETRDKREWLNFEPNTGLTLILESDPRNSVPKKKTGDYGDYLLYFHKAVGGKMFSATESLQKLLVDYTVGDKITITRMQDNGKTSWKIVGNRPEASGGDMMNSVVASRINSIEAKLDQVLKHIYGDTEKGKIPETTGTTKDATSLGF